jgi:hypothetical protein
VKFRKMKKERDNRGDRKTKHRPMHEVLAVKLMETGHWTCRRRGT